MAHFGSLIHYSLHEITEFRDKQTEQLAAYYFFSYREANPNELTLVIAAPFKDFK